MDWQAQPSMQQPARPDQGQHAVLLSGYENYHSQYDYSHKGPQVSQLPASSPDSPPDSGTKFQRLLQHDYIDWEQPTDITALGGQPVRPDLHRNNGGGSFPTVRLQPSFFRSLLSFSWLIHLLAVAATVGIVQLSFRGVYWGDNQTTHSHWYEFKPGEEEIQNGLQFAAKLHEIFIVGSLSAILMHIARRMLVSSGLPWGLMTGAYQVGSVEWLFSSDFAASFIRPRSRKAFFMALALGLTVVYAAVVGPASAIAILPVLDWWILDRPFNDQLLTSYIQAAPDLVFPQSFDSKHLEVFDCDEKAVWCPGSGYEDLKALMDSYAVTGLAPRTEIKDLFAETTRELQATDQFARGTDHVAVATTLHASFSSLTGLLWHFVDEKKRDKSNPQPGQKEIGPVNDANRPRIGPKAKDVFAPLVQVQCSQFSYYDLASDVVDNPVFHTGGMRNMSLRPGSSDDVYQTKQNWTLPEKYWNYKRDDRNETTFEWLDTKSLFPNEDLTLAALVRVPLAITLTNTDGSVEDYQDSLLLPCMVDARWVGVDITYDPSTTNLIASNLTDLTVIEKFFDPKSSRPAVKGFESPNVYISPDDWADLLDLPISDASTLSGDLLNTTAIPALLLSFVNIPDSAEPMRSFLPPKFNQTSLNGTSEDTAQTVSTLLSLAVADGMARVANQYSFATMVNDFKNGSALYKSLYGQTGGFDQLSEVLDKSLFNDTSSFVVNWKVEHYGWGYGLRSKTVKFGITMLLLHSGVVAVYAVYVVMFRISKHGWSSGALADIGELLTLALLTKTSNKEIVREIASRENKLQSLGTPVTVRVFGGDKLGMVVGDQDDPGQPMVMNEEYKW